MITAADIDPPWINRVLGSWVDRVSRTTLRADGKSGEEFQIIGIYMGWRGRSLPGWLDYTTFWGRKAAAERIGEGDMREFFVRLDQTYRDHQRGNAGTFLGLVTLGHSFGGQAVLRSVSAIFEQQLEALNRAPGYLRDSMPVSPPVAQPKQLQHTPCVDGIALGGRRKDLLVTG